jgi:NAD-dependent deacetylase
MGDKNLFEKAARLIKQSRKTIVLTGAGISTESGIPDFRSPGRGLWENLDPMEVLSEMEKEGIIFGVITQNIDNLHQKAGSKNVFEVHGNTREGSCLRCGKKVSFEILEEKVNKKQIPPCCDDCNGVLRPDVVLFGDPMPYAFDLALKEVKSSDLLIVIGSSLTVSPVNFLPDMVRHLIIINATETPYDYKADVVIREKK